MKAQAYLRRLKNHQRHASIERFDTKSVCCWNDANEGISIYNNVDFPLKLAPASKWDDS